MIGFTLILATLVVLPGIIALVCLSSAETPSLQSRPLESGSSLAAVSVIGFLSLTIHLFTLVIVTIFGRFIPLFEWNLTIVKGALSVRDFAQYDVIGVILYFLLACFIGMALPWTIKTRWGKRFLKLIEKVFPSKSAPVTLSKLCDLQAASNDLLLTGYVYYKQEKGTSDNPISGLVGGVSYVRLDKDNNVNTIVLLEPIPFVRFINPDTQQKVILEYGDPSAYQRSIDVQNDIEIQDCVIAEIGADNIAEVVFAIFDRASVNESNSRVSRSHEDSQNTPPRQPLD